MMFRARAVVLLSLSSACAGASHRRSEAPAVQAAAVAPSTPELVAAPPPSHEHAELPSWTLESLASGAKRLDGMGKVHRVVTTQNAEAQAFFDQGLALTWGFNHDEAARSFTKAGLLDPSCALCFWGASYTMGPNYNVPMLPERAKAAWDALGRAQAAAPTASPVEQALIGALAKRYRGPEYLEPAAMAPLSLAYAEAMREVAEQFPKDLDVLALTAEAQMNVNPWRLWSLDGEPAEGTSAIVALLERVLKADPLHAGANHYYIHAVEASRTPQRALPSADRLGKLVPGAGHIVHMPAHIYQRVGRYESAAEVNRKAIQVDNAYLAQVTPPGYYPFYLSHNNGFLAFAASMAGRKQEALTASRDAAGTMPRDVVCGMPGMDFFLSEPLLVEVRFGLWEELMNEPMPDAKYQTLVALYHHGQGMALAARGKLDEAKARAAQIRALGAALPPEQLADLNIGRDVLEVAASVVEARVAELEKKPDAIAQWERAVALEDKLAYAEPADWFYPLRHYLGAALLDAGKPAEAEQVYRADLVRNPSNGWALFGLWKALEAQGKRGPAAQTQRAFEKAWSKADIQLTRSAF
jgi:tetratricopeptide (TPR) repeat protein